MARTGRPKLSIDQRALEVTCSLPLYESDVANILGVSIKTLERYIRKNFGMTFDEYRNKNRGVMRRNIMAKQYELAMKGNTTMLIWCGKQFCGQKDQIVEEVHADVKSEVTYITEWGKTKTDTGT